MTSVTDILWKVPEIEVSIWTVWTEKWKKNTSEQGRIVHRSGLNNEYNKINIKDFIINSTMVKADIFWVKERNKVY